MDECCGNCKYHQYEDISQGWVAVTKIANMWLIGQITPIVARDGRADE